MPLALSHILLPFIFLFHWSESKVAPTAGLRQLTVGFSRFLSCSDTLMLDAQPGLSNLKDPKKPPSGAAAVVGGPLAPLTLPSKAESVVSITSQCSYSSTIVHVGDKKPQPDSG